MLEIVPNQPPRVGDRFKIMGTVDRSGATKQYLAWDSREDRWCIVRMLGFNHVHNTLSRARFEKEIHNHEKVQHPNVVPVYAHDASHPHHPWAAMAVAEGGSIADWMAHHGALAPYQAIDVTVDVCNGLHAAHQAGVSHGSLALKHVLIDRHGRCMVTGLRGAGGAGDVQADMRRAAALLYTMLTGEAFSESHAAGQLSVLPPAIARAIELTRRRGGYADITGFARDLEAAVLDLPMPSHTPRPLAGPDSQLPGDPEGVWSPDVAFEDVEHLARLTAEPSYTAENYDDPPTPGTFSAPPGSKPPYQPTPGPTDRATTSGRPKATGARPYQMSRGSRPQDFSADMYRRGDKPLYEEVPVDKDEPIWDGQLATEKVEEPEEEKPFLTNEMLMRLVLVAAGLFVALLIGLVGMGLNQVGQARVVAEQSAAVLVEQVRSDPQLVYALAHAGAEQRTLEDAYFEFTEAPNDVARVREAIEYVQLIRQQSRDHGLDAASGGGVSDDLAGRMNKLNGYYGDLAQKRAAWDQAAHGFPGILPVTLGLQMGPPYEL